MHPLTAWRTGQRPEITRGSLAKLLDQLIPHQHYKGHHRRAIWRIEEYEVVPSYEVARAIELATSGAVKVDAIISPAVRERVKARRETKPAKGRVRPEAA